MGPEWIVTTTDAPEPFRVEFRQLFDIKNQLQSIMLLWDYNSYYVNLPDRYMIVNGGRKIQPKGLEGFEELGLFYTRRNQAHFNVNTTVEGSPRQIDTSYLIGYEGPIAGELRQLLIQVSSDGMLWAWKAKK